MLLVLCVGCFYRIVNILHKIAGEKENQKKTEQTLHRREDQLSHLNVDIAAPASPAGADSNTDASAGGQAHPSTISREDSVMSVSAQTAALPPDTQKFLKFAGMFSCFVLTISILGF